MIAEGDVVVSVGRIVRTEDGREFIVVDGKAIPIVAARASCPSIEVDFLEEFWEWLRLRVEERTARDYFNVIRRLRARGSIDPSIAGELKGYERKALRKYVEFLWERGILSAEDRARWDAALKVSSKADVRSYPVDVSSCVDTIRRLRLGSKLRALYLLMYYSGCRLDEACRMLEAWSPDEKVLLPGGLECSRLVMLESHARYYLHWRRGKKYCGWIFFPLCLLEEVKRFARVRCSERSISKYASERGYAPPKLYRKLNYRVLELTAILVGVSNDAANFIQSRLGKLNVGDRHYADMLFKADALYSAALKWLDKILEDPGAYEDLRLRAEKVLKMRVRGTG